MTKPIILSRRDCAVGFGAALAVGLAAPAVLRAQSAKTLKLGHLGNEDNVWHKASLRFAEEVAQRTDGAL
jgi:TRAP-type transport system periplasmic protein